MSFTSPTDSSRTRLTGYATPVRGYDHAPCLYQKGDKDDKALLIFPCRGVGLGAKYYSARELAVQRSICSLRFARRSQHRRYRSQESRPVQKGNPSRSSRSHPATSRRLGKPQAPLTSARPTAFSVEEAIRSMAAIGSHL